MTSVIDDSATVRDGDDSQPLVLLLHGFGSNERDLPGLMTYLPSGFASASVRAPLTLDEGAYAWVPIKVPGRPDPQVVRESTDALLTWFDQHVAADRQVVLLGFSQGGLMVTQLLRARPERFAAGIVLSGFVLDEPAEGDAALAARQVPVFFGHGDADPIIAPDATARASAWLDQHAATVDRTYAGLAHSIATEELDDIAGFLRQHVPVS